MRILPNENVARLALNNIVDETAERNEPRLRNLILMKQPQIRAVFTFVVKLVNV